MPIGSAEWRTQYASMMTTSTIRVQTATRANCGDGLSIVTVDEQEQVDQLVIITSPNR
jgi:hypothetical protein